MKNLESTSENVTNYMLPEVRLSGDECPSSDYKLGEPNGNCWGDGHYSCKSCIHYREDFKRLGQDFIDFAHSGEMRFTTIK